MAGSEVVLEIGGVAEAGPADSTDWGVERVEVELD
jgi:hypothetical protein